MTKAMVICLVMDCLCWKVFASILNFLYVFEHCTIHQNVKTYQQQKCWYLWCVHVGHTYGKNISYTITINTI